MKTVISVIIFLFFGHFILSQDPEYIDLDSESYHRRSFNYAIGDDRLRVPNVTVKEGKDVEIFCDITNLGGNRVAWMKDDTKLLVSFQDRDEPTSTDAKYTQYRFSKNKWIMKIKKVDFLDRGSYICQVNSVPILSIMGYLTVVTPPEVLDDGTDSSFTIVEGESRVVRCKAAGHPDPAITWKRADGKLLMIRHNETVNTKVSTIRVKGDELHLHEINRYEEGEYRCKAFNGIPPSSVKIIHVKVIYKPTVNVPDQLIGTALGHDVELKCKVQCNPCPIMFWSRGNMDVTVPINHPEFNVSLINHVDGTKTMILLLKDINAQNLGNYTCVVRNSLGEGSGNIVVHESTTIAENNNGNDVNYADSEKNTKKKGTKNAAKNAQNHVRIWTLIFVVMIILINFGIF